MSLRKFTFDHASRWSRCCACTWWCCLSVSSCCAQSTARLIRAPSVVTSRSSKTDPSQGSLHQPSRSTPRAPQPESPRMARGSGIEPRDSQRRRRLADTDVHSARCAVSRTLSRITGGLGERERRPHLSARPCRVGGEALTRSVGEPLVQLSHTSDGPSQTSSAGSLAALPGCQPMRGPAPTATRSLRAGCRWPGRRWHRVDPTPTGTSGRSGCSCPRDLFGTGMPPRLR